MTFPRSGTLGGAPSDGAESQVEWASKHANILQALGTYNVRKVLLGTLNPC